MKKKSNVIDVKRKKINSESKLYPFVIEFHEEKEKKIVMRWIVREELYFYAI